MADVEGLVRIRLRVLDQHSFRPFGAVAILRALAQDRRDELAGDCVGVEVDIDEAVGCLDPGEAVVGPDLLGDLRRQRLRLLPRRRTGQLLGLLPGEPLELARRLQLGHRQITGQLMRDRRRHAPRSGKRNRPDIDRATRCQAALGESRADRCSRRFRLPRDDSRIRRTVLPRHDYQFLFQCNL